MVEAAAQRTILLRALGGAAIIMDVMGESEIIQFLSRSGRFQDASRPVGDLDFASYSRHQKELKQLFELELHYRPDMYVNTLFANRRNIFYGDEGRYKVDIFFDRLEFSHTVELSGGRLEVSSILLNPTDLLLSKLQIHEVNRKDLLDTAALLMRHDMGGGSDEIELERIVDMLSDDWGFWYDAVSNLSRTAELLRSSAPLTASAGRGIRRAEDLLSAIRTSEKTRRWTKRERKGTRKIWYNEVEEVSR